ncbi:Acetyltransferase (GNAT) domain [Ascochyta rabiei]|uniref:N-acetyltransferase n=1 Tax=Didymella rabiei TaxID=5454 RepID=A0A162VUZ9_DIDRA|nr:Acetyltransferase (GNAT) domain [Ascochyta rabiei]KZM18628.1 N-acetyltransferase [Ascochyta rabiei]UPX10010.1 Acetyltransferase (GNAT) domain [Ascochyta rabiei]
MSSTNPTVRHATRKDVPTILGLIQELADYEKASSSVEATVESLTRTLSHADPSDPDNPDKFSKGYAKTLLLTDPDGTIVGMALYFYNYSTWTGVPGIYLEDLFIKDAYRNKGYGTLLLSQLAKETLKVDGKRLEWSCLDWNEPSLSFYQSEKIGAAKKDEWVGLRVEGDKLDALAGSSAS